MLLLTTVYFTGLFASTVNASASLNGSTVFEPNLAGVACYRIPAVVQTDKGTLIAFAGAVCHKTVL
jgi:hypothetical protein